MKVVDDYSSITGLIHELNIRRTCNHEEICKFSTLDPVLELIIKNLNAGKA